jgi:hypothetical protein
MGCNKWVTNQSVVKSYTFVTYHTITKTKINPAIVPPLNICYGIIEITIRIQYFFTQLLTPFIMIDK